MERVTESEMQRRREIWINTPMTKLINADDLLSDNFIYNKPSRKHNDITIRETINKDVAVKDSINDITSDIIDSIKTISIQNQRVVLDLDDDLPF